MGMTPDNCGNYVVMFAPEEGLKDTSEKELAIIKEEYISKADYEARLKADMVAMFDKIRAEIERKAHSGQWSDATMYGMLKAVAIIDKYKAEIEPQEREEV